MTLNRLGLAVVTILTWASPSAAQTAAADRSPLARKPEVAAALTVLDSWIAATVAQREQPGLSIGVVYDQDLIWAKGYGYADLERRACHPRHDLPDCVELEALHRHSDHAVA